MESIINRLWVIHPIEGTNTAALHNNHIIEQGIEESEDD